MEKDIRKILEDLYKIDPSLRSKEEELKKIIIGVLTNKPETQFTEEFYLELRQRLLAEARLIGQTKSSFFAAPTFSYALSGVLAVALIAFGALYAWQNGILTPGNIFDQPGKISMVKDGAFGPLTATNSGQNSGTPALGFGAGGSSGTDSLAVGRGGGGGGAASSMIAPDIYNYKYVYKGGAFELPETQVQVLKSLKNAIDGSVFNKFVKSFNLSMISLSSFKNAKLQSFSVIQDQDYGYLVSVSLDEGVVSISQNGMKWPSLYADCQDTDCYNARRLKLSDLPSDEQLIGIASAFLAEHKISAANYGAPEVMKNWGQLDFAPDELTIVYPIKVEGDEIYDQGGNKNGLTVSVSTRELKVTSLWGLTSRRYEASNYEAETDPQKIIAVAEQGGINRLYYSQGLGKEIVIELGTPSRGYMVSYGYKDNFPQELLVPAMVFPIVNAPLTDYFYSRNIVVPLAKEMLANQSNPEGPIRIMQ